MRRYLISGIAVESEIEISSAPPWTTDGQPDVTIRYGVVPFGIARAAYSVSQLEIGIDEVLIRAPNTLAFHINQGRDIVISAPPCASAREIRLYLLGSAWGALLLQRGLLPLHASAIVVEGAAMAFLGVSGAGKSTLAAALLKAGYPLLCDDVCAVGARVMGEPVHVHCSPKGVKLWSDAAEALELERGETVVPWIRNKYYINIPEHSFANQGSVPLSAVYTLAYRADRAVRVEPLDGKSLFQALISNVFRAEWVTYMNRRPAVFEQVSGIARQIDGYRLTRPRGLDSLSTAVMTLIEHFAMRQP